jgi:hypothetical protein
MVPYISEIDPFTLASEINIPVERNLLDYSPNMQIGLS